MKYSKRFSLGKEYDVDGNYEYCYEDNVTGDSFNFADETCDTDFLEYVNKIIYEQDSKIRELSGGDDPSVKADVDKYSMEDTVKIINRIIDNFCNVGLKPTISEHLLINKLREQIISGLMEGVIRP